MKKAFLLSAIVLLFVFSAFADGWREGEKEIKVFLNSSADYTLLSDLKLNGDIYSNKGIAIMYVTPDELIRLDKTGLSYEVLKDDLNEYYRDFWNQDVPPGYYSYEEIIEIMDSLALNFPDICKKEVIGTSLGGRELAVLKISDNVEIDEAEAELIIDGGIHGDEIGGAENLIRFSRKLCFDYGEDFYITNLIDNREIIIYCMVNPDGRADMTRYNNNGIDLNRDWGYMWNGEGGSPGPYSQQETKAYRDYMNDNEFVMNVSMHSGVEVFLYAWYYRDNPSPDDSECYFIGDLYSSTSGYANLEFGQCANILYPVNGGSCESFYGVTGTLGFAQEISNDKQPSASQANTYYNWNITPMLEMIEVSGYGLEGIITDAVTGEAVVAAVFVDEYLPNYSDATVGDFHKFVMPGTYSITVVANGYESQTIDNIVVEANSSTTVDFQLQEVESHYAYRKSMNLLFNNFQNA